MTNTIANLTFQCKDTPEEYKGVSFTGLNELQKDTKQSLIIRCQNCMSHDWLWRGKAIPLRGYYVGLDWLRRIRKGHKDERVSLNRIHDIFKGVDRMKGVRILINGE